MFVPSFFPLSEGFVKKQEKAPENRMVCDHENQMKLFDEFIQKKLADFKKLESFRPAAS